MTRLDQLLERCQNFERELRFHRGELVYSLDRMRRLCAALGAPDRRLPCVHVTGTNGKGSTCAYVAALARAHGLRDGLYTSPHLISVRERIAIGGEAVAEDELVRVLERVLATAGTDVPSYFEALTLAAFLIFAERQLDLAVYEVGLGGRLDATNVVHPLAVAITTIGLDHTAVLGPTEEAIAGEKAGILKPGTPAFVGTIAPGPLAVIESAAQALGCELARVPRPAVASGPLGVRFTTSGPSALAGTYDLPTPAMYQAMNAALALELFAAAALALGVTPQRDLAASALSRTRIAGRFHVVPARPVLVLDGGHTEQALREVVSAFTAHFAGRPHCALVGALADKDRAGVARALAPLGGPCVVTLPDSPRALDPRVLLDELEVHGLHGQVVGEPDRALAEARRLAGVDGAVLVTGSFYLVARILSLLEEDRASV